MKQIKRLQIIAISALLLSAGSAMASAISGAGATFPSAVYKEWGKSYGEKTGVSLSYQNTGSGDGIRQIEAKAVDFGASDMPLTPEELEKRHLVQFPTVAGGVVPVINIVGIESGQLKLDGPTLANIYLGKITHWNDPAIAALNPGLKLPAASINVIHRTDASGTTFIFTDYLSKVSAEWKSAMGEGTTVQWKVGTGCRTNLLVPVCLYQAENSIAYMDYGYAKARDVKMVQLKNRAGQFVAPSVQSFQAATRHAKWEQAKDFYEIPTDVHGDQNWPIVGATYVVMPKTADKPEAAKEVLKFFDWAYSQGEGMASEYGYVPLPKQLHEQVRQTWATKIRDSKGSPVL